MKTRFLSHTLLAPALALASVSVQSQDLTVFQDSERNGSRGGFAQFDAQAVAALVAPDVPSLALKAVYRFGTEYHVSLESDEGGVYQATWKSDPGEPVSILNGYRIESVEGKSVILGLPAGITCQQASLSGGSCIGRAQISLSFAETEPVPQRNTRNSRNNNNNRTTFNRSNNNNNDRTAQIREFLEANGGNAEALQVLIANRGGGGGNNNGRGGGGGGGRGGRGGGGNNNGNNNGGNNANANGGRGGRGGRGGN